MQTVSEVMSRARMELGELQRTIIAHQSLMLNREATAGLASDLGYQDATALLYPDPELYVKLGHFIVPETVVSHPNGLLQLRSADNLGELERTQPEVRSNVLATFSYIFPVVLGRHDSALQPDESQLLKIGRIFDAIRESRGTARDT